MPSPKTDLFRYTRGFAPSQARLGGVPDSIIDGQNVWVHANGFTRSAKGPLLFGPSGSPRPAMNVGASGYGGISGINAYGTLILYYNAKIFAGNGNAVLNGSIIGASADQLMIKVGNRT
jgi:hypothetical protein